MDNVSTQTVIMKRLLVGLFALSFATCASLHAQVVPAGINAKPQLQVGVLGSALQPDFPALGCGFTPTSPCIGTSPNRIYGVGTYADLRLSRWIQPEFEARWSEFNTQGLANGEDTYLGGLRVPIHVFHKMHATPYGKFLIGWGSASGFLHPPTTLAMAYGGGIDLRLTRRFTLRAFDFEYQQWRVKDSVPPYNTLFPYEGSVGLSYRIF